MWTVRRLCGNGMRGQCGRWSEGVFSSRFRCSSSINSFSKPPLGILADTTLFQNNINGKLCNFFTFIHVFSYITLNNLGIFDFYFENSLKEM